MRRAFLVGVAAVCLIAAVAPAVASRAVFNPVAAPELLATFTTPEIDSAYGIEVLADGRIAIADRIDGTIEIVDASGNHLDSFAVEDDNGDAGHPTDVVQHPNGFLYVVEFGSDTIQVFDVAGNKQFHFGGTGAGDGEFSELRRLAVDETGRIYVPDAARDDVQVFSADGTHQNTFGDQGAGPGLFQSPQDAAIGPDGLLYITDNDDELEVWTTGDSPEYVRTIRMDVTQVNQIDIDDGGRMYVYSIWETASFVLDGEGQLIKQFPGIDQIRKVANDGRIFLAHLPIVADKIVVYRFWQCNGLFATWVGTNGRDTFDGTNMRDVVVARGGPDTVRGHGGSDVICLGAGNDRGLGGPGHDTIFGGRGADTLLGGLGNDDVWGRSGNDALGGSAGNDTLRGNAGSDALAGNGGDDRLDGGSGRDSCDGGPGIDQQSKCESVSSIP